jgi:hypothetical protein
VPSNPDHICTALQLPNMEHPNLRVERRQHYVIIVIDRIAAQNAVRVHTAPTLQRIASYLLRGRSPQMNYELMTTLARTFRSLNAESPPPRAIILTGVRVLCKTP